MAAGAHETENNDKTGHSDRRIAQSRNTHAQHALPGSIALALLYRVASHALSGQKSLSSHLTPIQYDLKKRRKDPRSSDQKAKTIPAMKSFRSKVPAAVLILATLLVAGRTTALAERPLKCNEYIISVWSRGASAADLRRHAKMRKADPTMLHVGVSCGQAGEHLRKFSIAELPWESLPPSGRRVNDQMCVRVKCSKRTNEVQKVMALAACPEDRSLSAVQHGRVLKVSLGTGARYNSLRWDSSTVWDPSTETNREVDGKNCLPHDLTKAELKSAALAAVEQCEVRMKADPKYQFAVEALTQEKPFEWHKKTVTKKANKELARLGRDPRFRDRLREKLAHYSEAEVAREMHSKFAVTTECMDSDFFGFLSGGKNKICRDSLQAWIDKKEHKCAKSGPTNAERSFRDTAERAIPEKRKMLRNFNFVAPLVEDVKTIHVLPPGFKGQFFDTDEEEPREAGGGSTRGDGVGNENSRINDGMPATKAEAATLLGIPESASELQVKKAYRMSMLKFHPDKYKEGGEMSQEQMSAMTQKLNAAKGIMDKALGVSFLRLN